MRVCLIGTQVSFYISISPPQVIEHNCNRKSCDGQVRPVFFSMSCGVQNCSSVLYSMGHCHITFLPSYFSSYLNNLPMYIVYCSGGTKRQTVGVTAESKTTSRPSGSNHQGTKLSESKLFLLSFYRWYHTIHLYVK